MEKQGVIAVLKMNRPPSNNLSHEFLKEIRGSLQKVAADPGVRCVLIASSLEKYFSTGMDLEDILSKSPKEREAAFLELMQLYLDLAKFPKPTLAAINGTALLGGWIMAMGCDFRFMAPQGKMALSEVRLGINPTTMLIQGLLGLTQNKTLAKEIVLTGKTVRAEEALAAGLVDRLIALESLMEESLRYLERLAELPPRAYAAVKKSYRTATAGNLDELFKTSSKEFLELVHGEEAKEGFAAMRDKRRPRFH